MTKLSPSGIYMCENCRNLETHVQGYSKAPCSKCESNKDWKRIVGTEELEKALKDKRKSIFTDMQNRYDD